MQAEARALVVAAEGEGPRGTWSGVLVEFGLAAELSHALGGRLDVVDLEEEVRTRARVSGCTAASRSPARSMARPHLKRTGSASGSSTGAGKPRSRLTRLPSKSIYVLTWQLTV